MDCLDRGRNPFLNTRVNGTMMLRESFGYLFDYIMRLIRLLSGRRLPENAGVNVSSMVGNALVISLALQVYLGYRWVR